MLKKEDFIIVHNNNFVYDEESIMSSLLVGVKWSNNRFTSPFRLDKKPDCKLIKSYSGQTVMYDPVDGMLYNCFTLYAKLNNVSLAQAYIDLKNNFTINSQIPKLKIQESKINTLTVIEKWTKQGIDYWLSLGINYLSIKDKVIQIEKYTYNNITFICGHLTFAYYYEGRYKIYCPLKDKPRFLLSNINGLDTWLINNNSDTLMICKSAKDQLVVSHLLKDTFDYCHVQSEGSLPKWDFLNYKHIIVFYDNDNAGIEGAIKMANYLCNIHFKTLLSIQCIFIQTNEKDASEYQLKHGKANLFQLLFNLLN